MIGFILWKVIFAKEEHRFELGIHKEHEAAEILLGIMYFLVQY
jgi:hypothetical protein